MARQETHQMRDVTVFIEKPTGNLILAFRGAEDHRVLVELDKDAADHMTQKLVGAGFGGEKR